MTSPQHEILTRPLLHLDLADAARDTAELFRELKLIDARVEYEAVASDDPGDAELSEMVGAALSRQAVIVRALANRELKTIDEVIQAIDVVIDLQENGEYTADPHLEVDLLKRVREALPRLPEIEEARRRRAHSTKGNAA